MPRLTKVTHHLENVLGHHRDHDLELSAQSITLICEAFEAIKSILSHIEENGEEPDADFTALIKKLDAIHETPNSTGRRSTVNTKLCDNIPMQSRALTDAQNAAPSIHLLPIGKAWSKLPHILKKLCDELDKKIDLHMIGQDTELEAQMLELIKDPLTHMVRNAVDHGIEAPAARLAAGKPETGNITLKAFHEGTHLIIEISDDGNGLSTEVIKKKILSGGLASAEELERMTPAQIQQFIFKPGISTAERVTAVSGRGVGMDVVHTNIEKIGGAVTLHSEDEKGATFTIKIPLTHSANILSKTRAAEFSGSSL